MSLSGTLTEAMSPSAGDLARSLNSLIKSNEGEWKSERQARFLLRSIKGDDALVTDAAKKWARARGFTNRDQVAVEVVTSIGRYGKKDPSKIRQTAQVFVLDNAGVLLRAKLKYTHPKKGGPEPGIDWKSAKVTFERTKDVKPRVDIGAEIRADVKGNAALIKRIEATPNWQDDSWLADAMAHLKKGGKIAPFNMDLFYQKTGGKKESMGLGAKLMEAARQRVLLAPGYIVTVRTRTRGKPGEKVAEGRISEVDPATHTVRVTDGESGATLEIDVDTERYDLWVKPPDSPVQREPKAISLFVRPAKQGAYTGGQLDY